MVLLVCLEANVQQCLAVLRCFHCSVHVECVVCCILLCSAESAGKVQVNSGQQAGTCTADETRGLRRTPGG